MKAHPEVDFSNAKVPPKRDAMTARKLCFLSRASIRSQRFAIIALGEECYTGIEVRATSASTEIRVHFAKCKEMLAKPNRNFSENQRIALKNEKAAVEILAGIDSSMYDLVSDQSARNNGVANNIINTHLTKL